MKGFVFAALLGCLGSGCADLHMQQPRVIQPTVSRTLTLANLRHTRPEVGVPGRIDHAAYDPVTQRLFVAALENCSVEVLDLKTNVRACSITNLARPQGIAIVPTIACAVVACGGDESVHVFDTRTMEEKKSFILGADADNVRYDSKNDLVFISYGETNRGVIAVIEPHTWSCSREFLFPSKPESFQLDITGNRLFVNLPKGIRAVEDGGVAVIDLRDGKSLAQIPLKGRARNFPMAFDAVHQRLFVATRLPARLIEINTQNYQVVAEACCTDDSDDLFYDAKRDQVIVIGGGFRPDLQAGGSASPCSPSGEMGAFDRFSVGPKGELTLIKSTTTAPHARTGLFVPTRDALYLAVPFRGTSEAELREYRFR